MCTKVCPTAAPQAISNTLWAAAMLGLQLIAEQAQQLLDAFVGKRAAAAPQAIKDTLWAVVVLGVPLSAQQLQQLVDAFIEKLSAATPEGISSLLLNVAKLQPSHMTDKQLAACEAEFTKKLRAANAQAVANMLWACAEQRHYPQQLLAGLKREQQWLQQLLAKAPMIDFASIAYACGALGDSDTVLIGALLQQAVARSQSGALQAQDTWHLSNLCWAAAVLDQQQPECVGAVLLLAAKCGSRLWSSMVAESKQQLYQVHLWLSDTTKQPEGLSCVLSAQQLQECRCEWEQSLPRETDVAKASQLQQQVFAAAKLLPSDKWQQPPVMEQVADDGAFSIDIAVTLVCGKRIAIEVDGPSHFLRPDNQLNGVTQARNRALATRSWTVVSVPFFEWNACRTKEEQVAYLQAKLKEFL